MKYEITKKVSIQKLSIVQSPWTGPWDFSSSKINHKLNYKGDFRRTASAFVRSKRRRDNGRVLCWVHSFKSPRELPIRGKRFNAPKMVLALKHFFDFIAFEWRKRILNWTWKADKFYLNVSFVTPQREFFFFLFARLIHHSPASSESNPPRVALLFNK